LGRDMTAIEGKLKVHLSRGNPGCQVWLIDK
jgi:hypothetical protein